MNSDPVLSRIVARFDNFRERKSRLLDYLLALYGERFSQNSLRQFLIYHDDNEIDDVILANKLAYLKSIVELGRDRAAAPDYHSPPNKGSHCGWSARVAMLLGFEGQQSYSSIAALRAQGFNEITPGSGGFREYSIDELLESGYEHFQSPPSITAAEQMSDDELRAHITGILPMEVDSISEQLLLNGIFLYRYRIGSVGSEPESRLFFIDGDRYWQLADFSDKASAIYAANVLRQLMLRLNRNSEGLHIIEHLLLRPQASSIRPEERPVDNFYSLRISVVLPRWTARCRISEFRKFAEETIRLNMPAHVLPQIYWLDHAEMLEFERLYDAWWQLKIDRESAPAKLDESAAVLKGFLLDHQF